MRSGDETRAEYLKPTRFIDSDHPSVIAFAERVAGGANRELDRAIALYYAVRDEFRYDPYRIDLRPEAMRASATLARGYGFCIAKSVLLAAAARVHGIPARLGFADVRNHLTTERLRRSMGTDVFVYHGYAELLLDGRWVKATPAFNRSLCERFGVATLEFDGVHDAVFQPFDRAGNRHMEYLRDHGRYADLPLKELRRAFERAYPKLMSGGVCDLSGRFEDDAVVAGDVGE
ncbi:MAG: transglutaminase family protein [Gemmatimonadales bacterium]|jgi:transglutaminase-like putative cysteine protease